MKNSKPIFPVAGILMLFAVLLLVSSCQKETLPQEAAVAENYTPLLDQRLRDYEVFELNYAEIFNHVQTNLSGQFQLNLNIPQHPDWNFTCINDDYTRYYGEDYGVYEITGDNQIIEREMHPITALECYKDNRGLASFMTFALGRMEAMLFDGETEYFLEPIFNYDEKAPTNLYVLYKVENAFVTQDMICLDNEAREPRTGGATNKVQANCYKVQVTYLGDYKFYQKWSSNQWDNSQNWKWNRWFYGMKRYHEYNQYPLQWTLGSQYQYSSANNNPSSNTDKQAFINECSAFYGYSWYNEGDCNMFWTGYNVTGVWGKADGIGRMCDDPAQAFAFGEEMPSTSQSNDLMAHEVGHTMGCHHDDGVNNFMHSSYNSWNNNVFGPDAEDDLDDHLASHSGCLGYSTCN